MADQRALTVRGTNETATIASGDYLEVGAGVKAIGASNLSLYPGSGGNVRVVGTTLVINGDHAGSGESAYLYVNRGTSPDVGIRWNEGVGWEFTNDGTAWEGLGGGGALTYDTVANCRAAGAATAGDLCYISETKTYYEYVALAGNTDDGYTMIQPTGVLSGPRWVAISGRYGHSLLYREVSSYVVNNTTVVMGFGALNANPNARYNVEHSVVVGRGALGSIGTAGSSGDYTVAIGSGALSTLLSGTNHVAVGYNAGASLTSATGYGVYLGSQAGANKTSGEGFTAIGYQAALNASIGAYGVCVGFQAGMGHTGGYSVYVGYQAGLAAGNSGWSVGVGFNSLVAEVSGGFNTATGSYSARRLQGGSQNCAYGYSALAGGAGNNASNNCAFGSYSVDSVLTGATGNAGFGYQSLTGVTTGDNNCGFGFASGVGITTGSGSICIGANSNAHAAATNVVVLGRSASATHDSSVVIGPNANSAAANSTTLGPYDLYIGDSGSSDVTIYANNNASPKRYVKYDTSESKWVGSDDGTTEYDLNQSALADEWTEIPTSDYTATPILAGAGATMTLSNTDWMDVLIKGTPIKWLVAGGVSGMGIAGSSPYMLTAEAITGLTEAHIGLGGAIYVDCVFVSGTTYRFDLYSSPALDSSHMIAQTANFDHTTSAARTLTAVNSSGVGGSLTNAASGCRAELFAIIAMWAGIVESAVRSGGTFTLTIGGVPFITGSASIKGLWVGPPEKVRKEKFVFGAQTLATTTDTFCLTSKVATAETIGPYSQIVKLRAYASDVLSGTARVNLMNNGNEVSTTSSHNGLLIAVADTWYETGVDIDRSAAFITPGDDIDVAVKVAETTARYLTADFYHVVL